MTTRSDPVLAQRRETSVRTRTPTSSAGSPRPAAASRWCRTCAPCCGPPSMSTTQTVSRVTAKVTRWPGRPPARSRGRRRRWAPSVSSQAEHLAVAERRGGKAGTARLAPSTARTHLSVMACHLPPRAIGTLAAEEDLPTRRLSPICTRIHHPAAIERGGQIVLRDLLVGEAAGEVSMVSEIRRVAELAEPHLLPEARGVSTSGCTRTRSRRGARPPSRPIRFTCGIGSSATVPLRAS